MRKIPVLCQQQLLIQLDETAVKQLVVNGNLLSVPYVKRKKKTFFLDLRWSKECGEIEMGSRVTFSAHESDRLIGASETVGTNFVNGKTSLNTVYTPSQQAGSNASFSFSRIGVGKNLGRERERAEKKFQQDSLDLRFRTFLVSWK